MADEAWQERHAHPRRHHGLNEVGLPAVGGNPGREAAPLARREDLGILGAGQNLPGCARQN